MAGRNQALFRKVAPMGDTASSSRERGCDRLVQLLRSTRPTGPALGRPDDKLAHPTTGRDRHAAPSGPPLARQRPKKMRNRLSEYPQLTRPLKAHAGSRAPECGAAIGHVLATHSMEIIMDLNTYLFFDGQSEHTFRLSAHMLHDDMTGLMRYSDAPSGPAAFKGCNRVIHVSLRVGDRVLMCSDTAHD